MLKLRILGVIIVSGLLWACNNASRALAVVIEPQPKVIPINEYFSLEIGLNDEKYVQTAWGL